MPALESIAYNTSSGVAIYDLYDKTLAQIIAAGYGDIVDGAYVLHRINTQLMAEEPPGYTQLQRMGNTLKAGFIKYCDGQLWTLARALALSLVDEITFTTADYNLIDALLPV